MMYAILAGMALAAPAPVPKHTLPPASLPPGLYSMEWAAGEYEMTLNPNGEYRWGSFVGVWRFENGTLYVHEGKTFTDYGVDWEHWYAHLRVSQCGKYLIGDATYPYHPHRSKVTITIRRIVK